MILTCLRNVHSERHRTMLLGDKFLKVYDGEMTALLEPYPFKFIDESTPMRIMGIARAGSTSVVGKDVLIRPTDL